MGSCISKYRSKSNPSPKVCPIQDKLVITSQPQSKPHTITLPLSKKNHHEPISPSPSSSTVTTTSSSLSTAFSSSCSSSILASKERSFSNEFLWSCIKENPHIIRVVEDQENVLTRENSVRNLDPPTKLSPLSSSVEVSSKPSVVLPQRQVESVPQKRSSSGKSPVVSRQKSFRRSSEPATAERNHLMTSTTSLTRRNSSGYSISSSPIRSTRINSDMGNGISRNSSSPAKRLNNIHHHQDKFGNYLVKNKSNVPIHQDYYNYYSTATTRGKENFRSGSPFNRNQQNRYGSPRKRETCTTTHHVRSDQYHQLDQQVADHHDQTNSVLGSDVACSRDFNSHHEIDDLDNPLISLDCFIFL